MLSVVATLGTDVCLSPPNLASSSLIPPSTPTATATASFLGWLVCALITQKFQLGAVLVLPVSLAAGILLFPRSREEGSLLELVWS